MIRVVTSDQGGLVTTLLAAPTNTLSTAWVFVNRGCVVIATGNGGGTNNRGDSQPFCQPGVWMQLAAPNGGAPASEFIVFADDEPGYLQCTYQEPCDFYVANVSITEIPPPPKQLTVIKTLVHPSSQSLRLFNLQIDGKTVLANSNGGSTGPQSVTPGTHKVSETGGTGTVIGDFYKVIGGDCSPDGTVTVEAGQSKTCTITNYDNYGGCAVGSKCCEPGGDMKGCRLCVTPPKQCP